LIWIYALIEVAKTVQKDSFGLIVAPAIIPIEKECIKDTKFFYGVN
jgi:hypothetical protein